MDARTCATAGARTLACNALHSGSADMAEALRARALPEPFLDGGPYSSSSSNSMSDTSPNDCTHGIHSKSPLMLNLARAVSLATMSIELALSAAA